MSDKALNNPAEIPAELDRWNWGAFFLNWIWGIGNSTFIALLALIPGVNLIMIIVLGLKGSRWAWRNRYWKDAEHFRSVQRKWAIAGLIVWILGFGAAAAAVVGMPYVLKNSEAYQTSMNMVRADGSVRAALGEPIEPGFWVNGNVEVQAGGTGEANLSIPVTGSSGSGTVISRAIRVDGQWDIRLLVVRVDATGASIPLVNKDNLPIPNTPTNI